LLHFVFLAVAAAAPTDPSSAFRFPASVVARGKLSSLSLWLIVSKILYERSVESERCEMFMAGGCVLDFFQVQKSCRILREFYYFSYSKERWRGTNHKLLIPRHKEWICVNSAS
jgi:hypothetical protein